MSREDIISKLKEIFRLVVHNGVDADQLSESSDIRCDLGVDSIGMIYMAVSIEKVFGIDMGDVSAGTFKTVGEVIDYIEERTESGKK